MVSRQDGLLCFSGYLLIEPTSEFAGTSTQGAIYRLGLSAVSDELLLDRHRLPYSTVSVGKSAAQLLKDLAGRVGAATFNTVAVTTAGQIGRFTLDAGAPWSRSAGVLATESRSTYRALDGQLSLAPIGSTSHSLSEMDGTLQLDALHTSCVKMLANDVTVTGEREPTAYVTEIFEGDGSTVIFNLTHTSFNPRGTRKTLIKDNFQASSIYTGTWRVTDPGGVIGITSEGLTCSGGNGLIGQTNVAAINNIEIGGALVLDCSGVQLQAGSDGLLCALYNGASQASSCFAGFRIKQSGGGSVVIPIVEGVEEGVPFSVTPGALYQLRLRIYCLETQRILQSYYSAGDGIQESFGGDLVPADASVLMEIQQISNGLLSSPVLLYEGVVANAAASCTFAILDSANLLGSVRSVTITQAGTTWVKSILGNGNAVTRRLGDASQGADCRIEGTGRLRFYATSVPALGERIVVSYRTSGRAVARLASKASIAAEQTTRASGLWQWAGSIKQPPARSSADCENAGSAMLNISTSRAATWKGTYSSFYPRLEADVWPGDILAVDCASQKLVANLVVRSVLIEDGHSIPEILKYGIDFANDWAEELSLILSSTVAADAWLPETSNTPVLENLSSLTVTSVSANAISLDAGLTPPLSGGFEVRRRDWDFGPGVDSDLILRSPVRHFILPRETPIEHYYVRMYDGSTPPAYSRFSSAVFLNS